MLLTRIAIVLVLAVAQLPLLPGVDHQRLEQLIGALTDDRRSVHEPAMDALIGLGPDVLPDLAVLAGDAKASVRARVALTASGIGGRQAFPLLERLTADRSAYVREVAVLGLGRTGHPGALALLERFLRDPVPQVRESAALALGTLGDLAAIPALTWWPEAGGARGNLQLAGPPEGEAQIRRIQKAMRASLKSLVVRSDAIPVLVPIFASLEPQQLVALLEMTWEIGDTRLSPALARLLGHEDDAVRRAAAISLAANGDGRALEALCALASGDASPEVRHAAGRALRRLTGHQASAGPAWALWWRNHREEVAAGFDRDAFIAALHSPQRTTDAAELAVWSPAELMPLVDGVLGSGAPWWPAQAWSALRSDDAARWTAVLLERLERSEDETRQVGLVVLLDELGDPRAAEALRERYESMHRAREDDAESARQGSLYMALMLAVEGADERALGRRKR